MSGMTGGRSMKQDGFTLVELLVVVAVALILYSAAVPSMRDLIDGRRVRSAADELLAAMHLARSEAIHRAERVDLQAADNDWRRGWTIFVDRNRNGQPDADDEIIAQHSALPVALEVESRFLDNGRRYLAYHPSGRTRTDASAQQPQFGTIRLRLGDQRRNIVLNMLGRSRLCTPPSGSDSC